MPFNTHLASSALLVVDMQHEVLHGAHDRAGVIARVGTMIAMARTVGAPVIWVQHSDPDLVHGSAGWEIVPDLRPLHGEPIVHKHHGDSFEGTVLEELLDRLLVGHLIVTGAQTDACIRMTMRGSCARGYAVSLVSDAHTTVDKRARGRSLSPEQEIRCANADWASYRGCSGLSRVLPATAVTQELTCG